MKTEIQKQVSSYENSLDSDEFLKEYFEKQEKSDLEVENIELFDDYYTRIYGNQVNSGRLGFPTKNPCYDDYEIRHTQEICPITGNNIDIYYPVAIGPVVKVSDKYRNSDVIQSSSLPVCSTGRSSTGPIYQTPLEKRIPSFILKGISRIPIIGRLYLVWFDHYRNERLHKDIFKAFGQEPKELDPMAKYLISRR